MFRSKYLREDVSRHFTCWKVLRLNFHLGVSVTNKMVTSINVLRAGVMNWVLYQLLGSLIVVVKCDRSLVHSEFAEEILQINGFFSRVR